MDAGPIPDLIPTVSALAALAEGETHIENAARLRLKESDRLATTAALIRALGGQVQEGPDALTITGVPMLQGGTADAAGDHRIAMSAGCRRLRLRGACNCHGQRMRRQILSRVLGRFFITQGGCPMSSVYTGNLTVAIFGQSHAPAIGVTIDGLPAGLPVDLDALQQFLRRRAPGQNAWSTPPEGSGCARDPLRLIERPHVRCAADGHHRQPQYPLRRL